MARIVIELDPYTTIGEINEMVEEIKDLLEDKHRIAFQEIHLEL